MKKRLFQPLHSQFPNSFFFELILFLFVIFTIVLPSVATSRMFIVPSKPETHWGVCAFFFKVFIFATSEELLYRLYLPFQMKRFFLNKDGVMNKRKEQFVIIISNMLFALAHLYLGILNSCFAFIMGTFFSFIYEIIKRHLNSFYAFSTISLIHFCYNSVMLFINIF